MPTNKAELALRRDLKTWMAGSWLLTWHEDKEINPGVPDLSYVMLDGSYETGWIELKAEYIKSLGDRFEVGIEPSQHQWIERHYPRIPVSILIGVNDLRYLIPGRHHAMFKEKVDTNLLDRLAIVQFHRSDTSAMLPGVLKTLTKRNHVVP